MCYNSLIKYGGGVMLAEQLNETLKNLDDLGIFQLRELAREIGVHLPTTMKKAELIQKIREVASGEAEPFVPTTKKGRPPKQYQTAQTESVVTEREYDYINWGKSLLPYAEKAFSVYKMSDNSSFIFDERKYGLKMEVCGVVSVDDAGNARLHEGTITQVGEKRIARVEFPVVSKFGLRDGDYVEGRIGQSLKDNSYCLFDVKTINGKPLPFNRPKFNETKAQPITQRINLDDSSMLIVNNFAPIGKGQRVLVRSLDNNTPKRILHQMAENLAKTIDVIYLTLDEQPEDYYNATQQKLNYILCPFDLPVEKQLYILELALSVAKRRAEMGQDVVVFVEDLFTVARLYSRCYKAAGLGEPYEFVLGCLKKLLACGRNILNGGTITLIVGSSGNKEGLNFDELLYEVKKACNCFITLNSVNYLGVHDINLDNTFTLNAERLLTQQETQNYYNLRNACAGKPINEVINILKQ